MKKNRKDSARQTLGRIAQLFDEVVPEELAEAEEELRALGLIRLRSERSSNNSL